VTSRIPRWLEAVLRSAALVAAVTAVVALLEPEVPALGLGVLYLLAVVPIALWYGVAAAGAVSLASMAAFSYFFLHPLHSLSPGTSERWSVLLAFLLSSLVVSQLAARSQREARRSARLADQEAALRRVATLVARGVPESELFAAVVDEVGRVFPGRTVSMARYEPDDELLALALSSGLSDRFRVGQRWPLGGNNVSTAVARTGRPARVDSYTKAAGQLSDTIRDEGILSSVGAPIVVEGRLWGVMTSSSTDKPLPADTEARLASFTDLVVTAIANSDARAQVRRLAEEQAALRRVATLVARESPPAEIFAAVAEEVERLLGFDVVTVYRYEADATATVVAHRGVPDGPLQVDSRTSVEGENVAGLVLRTGQCARIDDYANASGSLGTQFRDLGIRSAAGCPILVGGRLWGALGGGSRRDEPLPSETETRIGQFTELVATAIANIQARSELAASRARVVATADETRRRIERDLHDGAQQRLVHAIVSLKLARQELSDVGGPTLRLLDEALDHAERGNDQLRELVHGILPAVLRRGGLRAGVETLVTRMALPVSVDVTEQRLPPSLEANAYFICAEALTNVVKHAQAGSAHVKAFVEGDTLHVEVRDDGIGGAGPGGGSGLLGLQDRAAALNGELRIESSEARGTVVSAALPIPTV
jgi:signal transduction histidine kinase